MADTAIGEVQIFNRHKVEISAHLTLSPESILANATAAQESNSSKLTLPGTALFPRTCYPEIINEDRPLF